MVAGEGDEGEASRKIQFANNWVNGLVDKEALKDNNVLLFHTWSVNMVI